MRLCTILYTRRIPNILQHRTTRYQLLGSRSLPTTRVRATYQVLKYTFPWHLPYSLIHCMAWRYVPQRNTRKSDHGQKAPSQATTDGAEIFSSVDKNVDPAHISSVVRRTRRISERLKRTQHVIKDVLEPLDSFLLAHTARVNAICVNALGVGDFAAENGSTCSLLQMALFLAIVDRCRHTTNIESKKKDEELRTSQNAQSHQQHRGKVRVCATFYDPIATAGEKMSCSKLDIRFGDCDGSSLYASTTSQSLTVLFMPHCPWVLFHNVFAANWPLPRDREGTRKVWCALENLLIIGNNVGDVPPTKPLPCFVQLLPALECSDVSLFSRRKRKRFARNTATGKCKREDQKDIVDTQNKCPSRSGEESTNGSPVDDCEDADEELHLPGVGMRDVEMAFSDMSLTRLSPHWDIMRLLELVAKIQPPIARTDVLESA